MIHHHPHRKVFYEILFKIHKKITKLKEIHFKMEAVKWQPFCSNVNVLMHFQLANVVSIHTAGIILCMHPANNVPHWLGAFTKWSLIQCCSTGFIKALLTSCLWSGDKGSFKDSHDMAGCHFELKLTYQDNWWTLSPTVNNPYLQREKRDTCLFSGIIIRSFQQVCHE